MWHKSPASVRVQRIFILICACLVLTPLSGLAQTRNLTVAVLVNSQNVSGYDGNPASPGDFQRFAERYLEQLQVPYEIFDVASVQPPSDLSSRQLIIAGHTHLLLTTTWKEAIVAAVSAGTGFVNLDSDSTIGNESHIATIFGATGSGAGTAATQITVAQAVQPGGSSAHYIAGLQRKFDGPIGGNLVYAFHAGNDGVVRSATSTVLLNAQGAVIALLGNDPLILATTYGAGRAVHFGTLDYLHADRFGFEMGVDDLFWRSLVWAARKPFVLRGYPRFWSVQMDDTKLGWGLRVRDFYDSTLTGPAAADGIGGPWKVTGYLFTDNLPPGSSDRTSVIADINAGKLEVVPHSFGNTALGDMYWNGSSGPLTDLQWTSKMSSIDAWKQGNGGTDAIPSFSRAFVPHFWDLSDNTGYDLWNHYGFRYITSIQKPGFQATLQNNGAERVPARSFWNYEMPPKTVVDPNFTTENFPLYFADDYIVRSRSSLPAQTFFLFATQYFDFSKYLRPDFAWPHSSPDGTQTISGSVAQLQQYTWRYWSGLGPVQIFTHDSLNYENSTAPERQAVIAQASSWLNTNGARHTFMDNLGDYIYARSKSTLTRATFDGSQLSYTFTGGAATADGNLISTELLVFPGDTEGSWQTVPGFVNGLQVSRSLPPSVSSVTPSTGPVAGGTSVTITGAGFTADATVLFGENSASNVTYVNSSTLAAVTPAGTPTTVDLRVVSTKGTASLPASFTYVPPPTSCSCSVWTSGTIPAMLDSGDPNAAELGVKFRADANGFITGLRFYKGTANTGTHVGHLWTRDGTLLASATFTSESASGWQQVTFPSAVVITAGTTYVASYFAPNGHYSVDDLYFLTEGVDVPPLHLLQEGADGSNGVYSYGASGTFPVSAYRSRNYSVDVIFMTTLGGASGPTITAVSPASGASGINVAATITVAFDKAMDPATLSSSTLQLLDSSNNPTPASLSYNVGTFVATLQPIFGLDYGATYKVLLSGGTNGVRDTSGNGITSSVSWVFSTTPPPPGSCPCSIWNPSATPAVIDSGDGASVELGLRFRSDVNGFITGLRFYKSSANSGTHVAHLWTNEGALVASATFTSETSSGWQQVTFPAAVAIAAGTTYVASYFAPNGHYSVNSGMFTSAGVDNTPLHALQDGLAGKPNGVFAYSASGAFPDSTYHSGNYWVDVIVATSVGGAFGPTVTSISPASGASGASVAPLVSAIFSKALNPATLTTSTFQLLDSSNNPVPASVAYNPATFTATLTPAFALNMADSYRTVITGGVDGVRDSSGNPMRSGVVWLFTTCCSLWSSSTAPAGVAVSADPAAVEVGVKFRSDVSGFITGIRFYKNSANTGLHIAHLWTKDGTPLASGTFAGESASGWQQMMFPSAIAIAANTTYVASYFAPNGHYGVTLDYFTSTGVDGSPLHFLQDGLDGSNGLYGYGPNGTFPASSYRSSNYWVDIVFTTTVGGVAGPTVTTISPAAGTGAIGVGASVSATFSKALNPATVTANTFQLLDGNNPVSASVSYNAITSAATLSPLFGLEYTRTYSVVIAGGSGGVLDTSGNGMTSSVSWVFSTASPPPGSCPCSTWNTSASPAVIDSGDGGAVELGVRFRSDVNGFITGIRFYKGSANGGTHVGHLWTKEGVLLTSATFAAETASGWQQVTFPAAVAITAGTTYVASYFAPSGHYSVGFDYFASAGVDNVPLHLLKDGLDGASGVYAYGTSTTFPASTYRSSNYWVDVVFATNVGGVFGPSVTAVSPTSGATGVSVATAVSATFSKALDPATVTASTFRLLDSANNTVPASISYNAATVSAVLTPASALNLVSSYRVVITGGTAGIKDSSGNPMRSDVVWVFTIEPPPPGSCPCSVWDASAIPATIDSGDGGAVELGVKVRSDVNGYITGIRFYKSSANTGTHVAHLWANDGTLLASATFAGESGAGWQQVTFPSAIPVTSGTTYVASYFAPSGHYSVNGGFFASAGADNAPLHLLKDGADGADGVFTYGASGGFPSSTYNSGNYWVDVVFETNRAVSVTLSPPSVTGSTTSTGTVTLDGPAPSTGTVVSMSSSNTAVASVPSLVLVSAGQTSTNFTITTTAVASATSITISATRVATVSAGLSVIP